MRYWATRIVFAFSMWAALTIIAKGLVGGETTVKYGATDVLLGCVVLVVLGRAVYEVFLR